MKNLILASLFLFAILGCSKSDDSNPVNTEKTAVGFVRGNANGTSWYSNKIKTSKSGNTRFIKATQEFSNNPNFSSAILEFRISVNQAGVYGIGEDEPGYKYYIRAYYTLVSNTGNGNENYTAYYENTSLMTINQITDTNLNAIYNFTAHTADTLKTFVFSNGAIQITF
jgi:hypothetical protein